MKKFWLIFILATALSLAFFMACGDDDDDDNDDNDDDDDDDDNDDNDDNDTGDDDDDDTAGGLTVDNVTQSTCSDDDWNIRENQSDVIEVTWDDGVLHIDDLFAYVNCGLELDVAAEANGTTITVTENNTGELMDCMCAMDLSYEISGISADAITLVVKRAEEDKALNTLAELSLDLTNGNKKWYIPHVSIFAVKFVGEDPPGPTDTVYMRYGACDLYNIEDQQFTVKQKGDAIFVYGYDWFNIDSPGSPVEGCQIPVDVEIGVLGDDEIFFGTPSNEDDTWSLLTAEYPVPEAE